MQQDENELFEHVGTEKVRNTRCRACGRQIGNFFAARVSHGRAHVRRREAVEEVRTDGHIGFRIRAT